MEKKGQTSGLGMFLGLLLFMLGGLATISMSVGFIFASSLLINIGALVYAVISTLLIVYQIMGGMP